jgi:protein-S-isoprenylcysteine O-methyltransferase Ste14
MSSIIEIIPALAKSTLGIFEIVSISVIILCVLAILISILINFTEAKPEKPKKERKSIVETGTMFLFFAVFYLLIKLRIGVLDVPNIYIRIPLTVLGLLVIILGTFLNIKGRLSLGKNWANQIKIYHNQTLITSGVYRIVRHPLYASLIWMFYAASIIYLNYAAFLANTLVFIPFMYYRAKQEEDMLKQQFKRYNEYIKNVGMFFPK